MRTVALAATLFTTALTALTVGGCCTVPGQNDKQPSATKPGTTPIAATTPVTPGTERTAVPTSAEWAASPRLTTNGDDSCEAKKVREWIQVYCRHCANDVKKPGAICSDKYDFADPQMARGSKNGDISFYSKKNADKSSIAAHAAMYAQRLSSYPHWPEIADLPDCVECEVPASARPVEAPETTDRLPLLERQA